MLRLKNPGPLPASYCLPAPIPGQPSPRDFLSSQALTHTSPTPTPSGHPAQAPQCNVIPQAAPHLGHLGLEWRGVIVSGGCSLQPASQGRAWSFHLVTPCRGDFDPNSICLQGNKREIPMLYTLWSKMGLIFNCGVSFQLSGEWELSQPRGALHS